MTDNILWLFNGTHLLARGSAADVTATARETLARHPEAALLAFEKSTGRQTELDLRPSRSKPAAPPAATAVPVESPGPGRPKLGVVGREVTLLPRHWEWLGTQPGGASVALRKLVENAMKTHRGADAARQRQEAAYQFLSAIAGNLPRYEEVLRALFAGDRPSMQAQMKGWPEDVRKCALEMAFESGEE